MTLIAGMYILFLTITSLANLFNCYSISLAPGFSGLRRFPQGRGFTQWTGDDSKALMKVVFMLCYSFNLTNLK